MINSFVDMTGEIFNRKYDVMHDLHAKKVDSIET